MGRDNRRIVARRDAGRIDNTANATFRPSRVPSPGALAFGLITIALGGSRRNGRWSILKAASMFGALALAYYVVLFESQQLAYALVIPAWLGAWGPPLLFAGSAMLIGSIRLRRLASQLTA
jgi:hypothetical protein